MSVLRADPFSRAEGVRGSLRQSVSGGISLFILMFLSLALIVLSRLNHDWVQGTRGQLVEYMLPTLEKVSAPAVRLQQIRHKVDSYVEILRKIERLEQENEQLRHWAKRAEELEREIQKYRRLLNSKDTRTFSFVTGRVVADGRGPFARSVILNIGRLNDVRSGQPVVNGDGLVGRTLNTGDTATRVLLLSDLNSRIPVLFGKEGTRGVLHGNNEPMPEIAFAPQSAAPVVGDDVYTSGHGGLFPPGLRVGRIAAAAPKITVKLYADAETIDFVSVLLFAKPDVPGEPGRLQTSSASGTSSRRTVVLPTRPRQRIKRAAGNRKAIRARQEP